MGRQLTTAHLPKGAVATPVLPAHLRRLRPATRPIRHTQVTRMAPPVCARSTRAQPDGPPWSPDSHFGAAPDDVSAGQEGYGLRCGDTSVAMTPCLVKAYHFDPRTCRAGSAGPPRQGHRVLPRLHGRTRRGTRGHSHQQAHPGCWCATGRDIHVVELASCGAALLVVRLPRCLERQRRRNTS